MPSQAHYLKQLETLINQIQVRSADELIPDLLRFQEEDAVPDELRSLSIDAMLVAEGDTNGEFKTKKQLLEKLQEFKDASKLI